MLDDLTESLFSLFDEADGLPGTPGDNGQGKIDRTSDSYYDYDEYRTDYRYEGN